MLRVKIDDGTVEVANIKGERGSFEARRQKGWVDLPNGERRQIRIRLAPNKSYPPGLYQVGDGSFMVGQYGDLQLGTLELVPVAAAAAAGSGAR